jgi:MFS transporter, ACS family, tartrate transporter
VAVAIPRANALASAQLATRTRRLIGLRLLPFLFVLYITNYIDRTSVAYAAMGMSRELKFSDQVFGFGAGIFFISYVALQMPGALLVERWSARRMISASMIAWGSLTALTALVHTPTQLYAARFVLGAAEAGFFPGVIVYLSRWFIREDRAKATSNFMAAIPLSYVIASPLAGWTLSHSWFRVQGWRWLFVLEGMPAIVLGIVAFFYLTDWPREAAWIAAEQKVWIEETLREEKSATEQTMSIRQVLRSRTVLMLAGVSFLNYFVSYSFAFWFPTMLKRLSGFSDVRVGLFGALPYLACFILMQVNGWHSDRSRERHWHSAVPVFIAAVGLIGLITQSRSVPLSLLLFTLLGIGSSYLPVLWAIPTEILSQKAAAAAVGMISAVGSIAGFAGPYLFGYLNTRTGSFSYGLVVMTLSAVAGGVLMLNTPRKA